MDHILAITLQSMQHDMTRLDRVGINLANATTTGYKRDVVAVQPFGQLVDGLAALNATTAAAATETTDRASSLSQGKLSVRTDDRPGTLKATGQSLDLALAGGGYFEVLTPQGPAWTRQGNFQLDARGRLVTAQGFPVMGKGGEIVLSQGAPTIDATGQVFENATAPGRAIGAPPVAQLRVVGFEATASMERLGDGLVSGVNPQALDDKDVQVRQGHLENSNVSSMQEMVQLIQTMRHFESMQRVAVGYDGMLGAAIRRLGEAG